MPGRHSLGDGLAEEVQELLDAGDVKANEHAVMYETLHSQRIPWRPHLPRCRNENCDSSEAWASGTELLASADFEKSWRWRIFMADVDALSNCCCAVCCAGNRCG